MLFVGQVLENIFSNFSETYQKNPTRYPGKFDLGRSSSRLDRILFVMRLLKLSLSGVFMLLRVAFYLMLL